MGQDWLGSDGKVVHPNAPRGGGGAGSFQSPKHFGGEVEAFCIPHPNSPAGRNAFLTAAQVQCLQENKLKFNKLNAQAAVDYVQDRMTLGAGNKPKDVVVSLGDSATCVVNERRDEEPDPNDVVPPVGNGTMPIEEYLREVARIAEKNGCGNCGEQSAMAFVYLLNGNTRPIDWMCLEKEGVDWWQFREGDHAFVIVGRSPFSNDDEPDTWGPEAIVCDPWNGDVYPPHQLIPKWGHRPRLLYRVEGQTK